MTLANTNPANLARATIEGVLWSLAYGVQVLREQTTDITQITLTGGASQSPAVHQIATAVFGLPITVTDTFESVAVGAAKQAAWALTKQLPQWEVPILNQREPTDHEVAASSEINARYQAALCPALPSLALDGLAVASDGRCHFLVLTMRPPTKPAFWVHVGTDP